MSQLLITEAMLDQAATALQDHRPRKGRCSCGSATPVARHRAEVVADSIAPTLVAEMMDLLAKVRATYETDAADTTS